MVKRIITSVVALAVFVGILFLPPICFTVALAAVILFMLYECYSATKADVGMKTIGFISAVILMSSIYFCKAIEWDTFAWATASIGIIFIIALCPCYFFLWFWSQNQAFLAFLPIVFFS